MSKAEKRPLLALRVADEGLIPGRSLVVTRDSAAGSLLLFEPPLAAVRAGGEEPSGGLRSGARDEYRLTSALLGQGKRSEWCGDFACDAALPRCSASESALASAHGCTAGEVNSVAQVRRATAMLLSHH